MRIIRFTTVSYGIEPIDIEWDAEEGEPIGLRKEFHVSPPPIIDPETKEWLKQFRFEQIVLLDDSPVKIMGLEEYPPMLTVQPVDLLRRPAGRVAKIPVIPNDPAFKKRWEFVSPYLF